MYIVADTKNVCNFALREQNKRAMKVRFTYYNVAHADDFAATKKHRSINTIERENRAEFVVDFKSGTKFETMKAIAGSAYLTLV